jgi:glycyl-tRNA synthetase beta chain
LRRAALGVIQIMIDREWDVDLGALVDMVAEAQPVAVTPEVREALLVFLGGRLQAWLQDQDWATDVLAAVLAEQSTNPYRALTAVRELSQWVQHANWEHILDNFARCVRITRSEAEEFEIAPGVFAEPQERALYEAYTAAQSRLDGDGNVDAFLSAFEPMVPAIADFFDHVLVNADDRAVRENRIGLLQAIGSLQQGRADLSQLSGF